MHVPKTFCTPPCAGAPENGCSSAMQLHQQFWGKQLALERAPPRSPSTSPRQVSAGPCCSGLPRPLTWLESYAGWEEGFVEARRWSPWLAPLVCPAGSPGDEQIQSGRPGLEPDPRCSGLASPLGLDLLNPTQVPSLEGDEAPGHVI